MFCEKCGQPNDDDALFCEFCGAGFNGPTAGEQAVPAPAPVYAAAAAPVPKKRRKAGVIAAIISLTAFIAWVVYIVFFWNKYPATTTDSYDSGVVTDNSGVVTDNSGTSAPAQTGKPTMTVNGNNVHVDLTEFVHYTDRVVGDASYGVAFAGKTDDEVFMLEMRLPEEELKSNTTINGSDNNNFYLHMDLTVTGKAWGIDEDFGVYNCADGKITEYTLEIGQFVPDEYIEITFSAKTEINGRIYNIKADGKLNFDGYNYFLSKAVPWIEEKVYPTPD